MFRKLRKVLSLEQLILIYHALFGARAFYGIVAWGGAYNNALLPLETLQRRALKVIHGRCWYESLTGIFPSRALLSPRLQFSWVSLLHGYSSMSIEFSNSSRTSRNSTIRIPLCKKAVGQKCSSYVAATTFNRLPKDMKLLNLKCKDAKIRLKLWLVQNSGTANP